MIYFSSKYYLFVIIRFFNGFFTVFFAIYTPVWIDQFIPVKDKSVFMAFQNLESVFGTILGMILTSRLSLVISWRYSFFIQAFLLFVLSIFPFSISSYMYSRSTQRIDNEDKFIIRENILKEYKKNTSLGKDINKFLTKKLESALDETRISDNSTTEIYHEINKNDDFGNVCSERKLTDEILKVNETENQCASVTNDAVSAEELRNYKKETVNLTYVQIVKQLITNYVSKIFLI